MSALGPKARKVLLDSLVEQGCGLVRTKNGWRILFPDGVSTASLHISTSDKKAWLALRAKVKRAGLTWPEGVN